MNAMIGHRVRHMLDADVKTVLKWRNHPSIQSYMHTNHEISIKEHEHWFIRCVADNRIRLLIYEIDRSEQGFMKIEIRRGTKIADWGFYTSPDAPKGSGQKMCKLTLEYVFTTLNLDKICGQALHFNKASIGLHRKLGFSEETSPVTQLINGSKNCNMVYFGLLKNRYIGINLNE
jgi:UDP-4-amino-4,6-dideoxy-N-acetyl-beta-L-altrosamine N-acetyltransferase